MNLYDPSWSVMLRCERQEEMLLRTQAEITCSLQKLEGEGVSRALGGL